MRSPLEVSLSRCVSPSVVGWTLSLFVATAVSAAQPGELDPRFSGDGVDVVAIDAGGDEVDRVTALATNDRESPSALTYALASVEHGSGQRGFQVRAYQRDGSSWPIFGNAGVLDWFEVVGAAPDGHSAAGIAADGAGSLFVLAGVEWSEFDYDFLLFKFDGIEGLPVNAFGADFSTPGRRNLSFDLGGSKRDEPVAIAVDSLGVAAAGWIQVDAVDVDFGFARVDATSGQHLTSFDGDGKRVVAFNRGGSHRDILGGMASEPDGDLIAAGLVETALDRYDLGLTRVQPSGALDSEFGTAGQVVQAVDGLGLYASLAETPVALDDQGRILVAAAAIVGTSVTGTRVWRFLSNGALDTSFGGSGSVLLTDEDYWIFPTALVVEDDGGILVSSNVVDIATASWEGMLVSALTSGGAAQTSWIANDAFTFLAGDHADSGALLLGWQGEIWLGGASFEPTTLNWDLGVARLLARRVFADGFESGNYNLWSANSEGEISSDAPGRYGAGEPVRASALQVNDPKLHSRNGRGRTTSAPGKE